MEKLRIISIGNSLGGIFSKEMLAKINAKKGDILYAIETPNGIELTPYDPEFAYQMEIAEEIMHEDKDVLKKLAE